jgi:hopene-associated glycosyltransferase HpnB
MPLTIFAILVLVIWLGMWLGNGFFWRIDREPVPQAPAEWPDVIAVIPARNEEALIGETVASLFDQGYPGGFRIVVVDDHSEDATAEEAVRAAEVRNRSGDLRVLAAEPLPEGWAGKVWAMDQGIERGIPPGFDGYVLLCDADIHHGRDSLRELVCRAEANQLDLASVMVRLRCESVAEKLLIPAFVFFFRMLYPFRRVNNPADRMAGAAGGTMLVRMSALERIGGLASIRGELIDDCSLARQIKRGGRRIWLGLSDSSYSTRGYGSTGEIVRMIARTAYTQLGRSPIRLIGCIFGLAVTFVAPVVLLFAFGWPSLIGAAAWLLMALLYLPMVRFYRQSPLWSLLLPAAACVYLWATLVSAWNHHRGRGGQWKGRAQSASLSPSDR